MKEIKRKLLLTAFVIVFAFVATAGTTYAWFQISPTVEAESLNFNMQSKDSLLLRVYNGENPDDTYYYYQNDIYNFYQELQYVFHVGDYYTFVDDDEPFPEYTIDELTGNLIDESLNVVILSSNLYSTFDDANTALDLLFNPSSYYNYLTLEDILEAYPDYLTWILDPVTAIQPENTLFPDTSEEVTIYAYTSVDASKLNLIDNLDYTRSLVQIGDADINHPYVDDANYGKVIQLQFWLYSQSGENKELRLDDLSISGNNDSQSGGSFMDDAINAIRVAVQAGSYPKTLTYYPGEPNEEEVIEELPNDAIIYGNFSADGIDYDFEFIRGLYGYMNMYDKNDPEDQRNYYEWSEVEDPLNPGSYIDELDDPIVLSGFNKIEDIVYMEHGLNPIVEDDDLVDAEALILADSSHGVPYGSPDSSVIASLQPYRPLLTTITIYVEGWDEQCTNNILSSSLNIDISLTIKEEE
ncbi:MAG: hypothetical protein WC251_03075 [Candidatus Izemoplasmatales bacterium]|jgi:hypothetical protein